MASVVSINSLARRLNVDSRLVRGIIVGLGLETTEAAGATLVSRLDGEKIVQAYLAWQRADETLCATRARD